MVETTTRLWNLAREVTASTRGRAVTVLLASLGASGDEMFTREATNVLILMGASSLIDEAAAQADHAAVQPDIGASVIVTDGEKEYSGVLIAETYSLLGVVVDGEVVTLDKAEGWTMKTVKETPKPGKEV